MMMSFRFFGWLAVAVICSLLLAASCAPLGKETTKPDVEAKEQIPKVAVEAVKPEVELEKPKPEVPAPEPVTLALKFTPQDLTTYKVIMAAQRSIKWEGSLPDKSPYHGGRTGNRIEMTFTQQIQSIDDEGNAIATITVKGLKYSSTIKDKTVVDFDSSNITNPNLPMALLLGQSYTIKIAPTGQVIEVVDVKEADTAIRKGSAPPKNAIKLLSSDAIKERHTISVLPPAGKNKLSTGGNWSSLKTFSFGMMGSKSYEKIYTLKEVKDADDGRIAMIEMNAIPSSGSAEQLAKEQAVNAVLQMFNFDNTETYTGRLKWDLTAGKVQEYSEALKSEWIAVDPSAGEEDEEPAVLKMTATRLYRLERID